MPSKSKFKAEGVIPACLMPFREDFSVDEPMLQKHLRHIAKTDGVESIVINAHASEVSSCTFEEQERILLHELEAYRPELLERPRVVRPVLEREGVALLHRAAPEARDEHLEGGDHVEEEEPREPRSEERIRGDPAVPLQPGAHVVSRPPLDRLGVGGRPRGVVGVTS